MKFRIPLTLRNALEKEYPKLNWNTDQDRFYGFANWLYEATVQELSEQGLIFEDVLARYDLALVLLNALPDAKINKDLIARINQTLIRERGAAAAEQRASGAWVVQSSQNATVAKGLSGEALVEACQQALELHFEVQPIGKGVPKDCAIEILKRFDVSSLASMQQASHYWERLGKGLEVQAATFENSCSSGLRKYLLTKHPDEIWNEYFREILTRRIEPGLSSSAFHGRPLTDNDVKSYVTLGDFFNWFIAKPYKKNIREISGCFTKFLSARYVVGKTPEEWQSSFDQLIDDVTRISGMHSENGVIDFTTLLRKNPQNYFALVAWFTKTKALEELLVVLVLLNWELQPYAFLESPLIAYLTREGFMLLMLSNPDLLVALARRWSANLEKRGAIQTLLDKLTDQDWQEFSAYNYDWMIFTLIAENNAYCLQRFDEKFLLGFVENLSHKKDVNFMLPHSVAAILGSQFCEKIVSDEGLVRLAGFLSSGNQREDDVLSQAAANPRFMARMTEAMWFKAANDEQALLSPSDFLHHQAIVALFSRETVVSLALKDRDVAKSLLSHSCVRAKLLLDDIEVLQERYKDDDEINAQLIELENRLEELALLASHIREKLKKLEEIDARLGNIDALLAQCRYEIGSYVKQVRLMDRKEGAAELIKCLQYYVTDPDKRAVMQAELSNHANLDHCFQGYFEQVVAFVLNNAGNGDDAFLAHYYKNLWPSILAHYQNLWPSIQSLDTGMQQIYSLVIDPGRREGVLELAKRQTIVQRLNAQAIRKLAERSGDVAVILLDYPHVQAELALDDIQRLQVQYTDKMYQTAVAAKLKLGELQVAKQAELERKKIEESERRAEEARKRAHDRFPGIVEKISRLPANCQAIRLHAEKLENNPEALTEASIVQLGSELNFLTWNEQKVEAQQRTVEAMLQRLESYGRTFLGTGDFVTEQKGKAVLALHKRLTAVTNAHYSDPSSAAFRSQSIQSIWIKTTEYALGECGTFLKTHRNGLLEAVQTLLINAVSVLLIGIPWLVNKRLTGDFFLRIKTQTEKQLTSMNEQLQASLDVQRQLVEGYSELGKALQQSFTWSPEKQRWDWGLVGEAYRWRNKIENLEEERNALFVQSGSKKDWLELGAAELLDTQASAFYELGKYYSSRREQKDFSYEEVLEHAESLGMTAKDGVRVHSAHSQAGWIVRPG